MEMRGTRTTETKRKMKTKSSTGRESNKLTGKPKTNKMKGTKERKTQNTVTRGCFSKVFLRNLDLAVTMSTRNPNRSPLLSSVNDSELG